MGPRLIRALLNGLTLALTVGCMVAVLSPRAHAEPQHTAVLVVPSDADEVVREITARLQGELAAAGFGVSRLPLAEASTPRMAIERAANQHAPTAVILVRKQASAGASVELWISDRVLGRTSNTLLSVPTPERDQARRLAVEAVELLRARMAELLLGAEGAQEPRELPVIPTAPTSVRSPWRTRLALAAGARLLWRRHLWELATLPTLAGELFWERPELTAWHLEWALTLRASGYGQRIARNTDRGSASAQQGLGLIGLGARGAGDFPVQPELTLGAGVYGVGVRGEARPPYAAHEARSFTPLLSSALGIRARVVSRLVLRLSVDLLYALHKSSVRVAREQVARSGGTMGAVNLELSVRVW